MWHDFDIELLHLTAKDRRAGYLDAILKAGLQYGPPRQVRGKMWIRVSQEDKDRITDQFNRAAPVIQSSRLTPGLGDVIARVATPVAKMLKLPCVDSGAVPPGSPCDQRRKALNSFGRKIGL